MFIAAGRHSLGLTRCQHDDEADPSLRTHRHGVSKPLPDERHSQTRTHTCLPSLKINHIQCSTALRPLPAGSVWFHLSSLNPLSAGSVEIRVNSDSMSLLWFRRSRCDKIIIPNDSYRRNKEEKRPASVVKHHSSLFPLYIIKIWVYGQFLKPPVWYFGCLWTLNGIIIYKVILYWSLEEGLR